MAVPFLALDAAVATGAGVSRDLGEVADHHTLFVTATGSPSSWTVKLQGSHDDLTWVDLHSASGSTATTAVTAPQSDAPGHLVRYIRANLTSLVGGSSPTVTATIASDTSGED